MFHCLSQSAIPILTLVFVLSSCAPKPRQDVQRGNSVSSAVVDNTEDRRILLQGQRPIDGGIGYLETTGLAVNTDPPNEEVFYSNARFGVSLRLPYNSDWGTANFRIRPYEEWDSGTGVTFGPITPCEGGRCRHYTVEFDHPSTLDAETAKLLADDEITRVQRKVINGFDVLEYRIADPVFVLGPHLLVIGNRAKMLIKRGPGNSISGSTESELMERIVNSIQESK